MTSPPDENMSHFNVFILTYIAQIYPMKGFLKMNFLKKYEWKNLLYIRSNT